MAAVLPLFLGIARPAGACYDSGDYSVRSPAEFPLASPGDSIEIFFLRAPLEEASLHTTLLGAARMFHSGAGFRSSNGSEWQFEYDAKDFSGSIFPSVQNGSLVWT